MARTRLAPEATEALRRRQAALTALSQHPSWSELEDEVNRKQARLEKVLVARFVAGAEPLDQRQVDFIRGFVAGMRWFAAVPNVAESRLESYLRQHGVNLEGSARE